jgi:hypothetical protein
MENVSTFTPNSFANAKCPNSVDEDQDADEEDEIEEVHRA